MVAVDLNEKGNEFNRKANEKFQLVEKIQVIDGSFTEIPKANQSFDFVWSQDSFLHADEKGREKV